MKDNYKKICFDLRLLNVSGIGTFLKNLIPNILRKNDNFFYYLLGNVDEIKLFISENNLNKFEKKFRLIEFNNPLYSISEQLAFKKIIPSDTYLYFSTHYNSPLFFKAKMIVVIYDFNHLDMFRFFSKNIMKKIYAYFFYFFTLKKSNKVISISNFSKERLFFYFKFAFKKTKTVYLGSDHLINEKNTFKNNLRYKNFILYVGNVKPHKNLMTLVNAFNLLDNNLYLLIVGKKENFITPDNSIFDKVKNNQRIIFTGVIDNNYLTALYKNALLFVFPSLYEGFGLPPLEAMRCSCPVVCSDIIVHREIYGDSVLYFEPLNFKQLSSIINKVISNNQLRNKLIKTGSQQSRKYTWEKTSNSIYNEISNI